MKPEIIDPQALKKLVMSEKGSAVVLFTGEWCPDCKAFKHTWQAWARSKDGPVFQVDVARGSQLWAEWKLDEIPTVALFVAGSEKGRVHGVIADADLQRLWEEAF
jgi:thioredoxin-like negative regulator of GroEL